MDFEAFRAEQAAQLRARLQVVLAHPNDVQSIVDALVSAICAGDAHNEQVLARGLFPGAPHVTPMQIAPIVLLQDWCAENNARYCVTHPPRVVKIFAASKYATSFEYVTKPLEYGEIADAQIVPGWDQVIAPDGRVIADTHFIFADSMQTPKVRLIKAEMLLPQAGATLFYAANATARIDGDVFFLSAPYNHFGHFMVDFLPRLLASELVEGSESWKLAVPDNLPAKWIEGIKMMGFDEERILKLRIDTRYACERLHVFKIGSSPSHPVHPDLMRYLRSKLYPETMSPCRGKRYFLERGAVGTRLVANAAEFGALLDAEGFTRVDVATLSLTDQQKLLADAEIIMGPFGSNLFAVFFAPPGATLINIMGEHRGDNIVQHVCHMIGVKYQLLLSKLAVPSDRDPDVIVDCGELQRRLSELSH